MKNLFAFLILLLASLQIQAQSFDIFKNLPSDTDEKTFDFHDFYGKEMLINGRNSKIVQPKIAAPGKPWIWRARFWGHEPQTDIALLEKGFHLVYTDVGGLFGGPEAIQIWDDFYQVMQDAGLSEKVALEGMSRGGLIIYNWAIKNPEKIIAIYADAPVLDFKSWPAGKGKGKYSAPDWKKCINTYGFSNEKAAMKYKSNPVDFAPAIAKLGIPLLHVCGLADEVVPYEENTGLFADRILENGGKISLINKEGGGHHPHSLKDPTRIVSFILEAYESSKKAEATPLACYPDVSTLKTFGTMGKELRVLKKEEETILFDYEGKGCITHLWFGGSFKNVEYTDIRFYIDGEQKASIDMELFLGHGIGFGDNESPWGTERMGNIGGNSGIYNTYKIPFGKSIKITAQLAPDADENPMFWWIVRGTENLPIVFDGVKLPDNARLKLHKLENHIAEPLEEFNICDVEGAGMLYQVTMEAKSLRNTNHWKDLSFMEACVRAYFGGSKEPMFLSSGLEDYFLGTYYFNKGRYTNMLAGLTHIDKKGNAFSGYRLHEDDPVFFQNGLRLTNRCGEKIGDKIFHDPPKTRYTTYVWVYEW